ncbi:hypothetical protein L4D76_00315 [Photobacterium sagamiensis]|uniref:peptidylprolyl isomerase n=1 Tax=Photobacterium sagamiensis TaxID=2910241 RepID=UPI003D0A9C7C
MQLNCIRKPYGHFILIGALLFGGQQLTTTELIQTVSRPSPQRITELRDDWLSSTGKVPSEQQLAQLVQTEIDKEIMYSEAFKREFHLTNSVVRLRLIRDMRFLDSESKADDDELVKTAIQMNLHENDLVIRGLMIQLIEELAYSSMNIPEPQEQELLAMYEQRASEFMMPPLVGFSHIFVSNDRNQQPVERAQQLLAQELLTPDASDPFRNGLKFSMSNQRLIERYFGGVFAKQLMTLAAEQHLVDDQSPQWLGPVSSSYGEHLVLIDAYTSPKQRSFANVRSKLLTDWRRQKEQAALDAMMVKLRKEYEVES